MDMLAVDLTPCPAGGNRHGPKFAAQHASMMSLGGSATLSDYQPCRCRACRFRQRNLIQAGGVDRSTGAGRRCPATFIRWSSATRTPILRTTLSLFQLPSKSCRQTPPDRRRPAQRPCSCCMISPGLFIPVFRSFFQPVDKRHVGEFRIRFEDKIAKRNVLIQRNRRRLAKQFASALADRAPGQSRRVRRLPAESECYPWGETTIIAKIARQCGFRSAYAGRATPRRRTICRRSTDCIPFPRIIRDGCQAPRAILASQPEARPLWLFSPPMTAIPSQEQFLSQYHKESDIKEQASKSFRPAIIGKTARIIAPRRAVRPN